MSAWLSRGSVRWWVGAVSMALLSLPVHAETSLTSDPGSRGPDPLITRPLPTSPTIHTEHLLLSGEDSASPRMWSIAMATGPLAGREVEIAVPGQWETSGFGTYAYGHQESESADRGRYRTRFEAPERWRGQRVEIVFEGVMTDTTVYLNGEQVGPTHRGGYTEFRYDLTPWVQLGRINELEVEVAERSEDQSVNLAERKADYWVFGGIYRPVRLEVLPAAHVSHVAIDARHDGSTTLEVELAGLDQTASTNREGSSGGWWVDVELVEGGSFEASAPVGPVGAGGLRRTKVVGRAAGISAWSAESPNMAMVEVRLRLGTEVVHVTRERFGFRTVEVSKHGRIGLSPGIWINGERVFLRGINRHDSWPATGRSMARQRARADAELLLALGFNAVRTAHYPPSRAFLDACDELGIYVIDELTGWKQAYSDEAGRPLVAELVRRDVNRPSVILWANGNEGGWNRRLTQDFALHDPQRRPVILPDEVFGGFDTHHYPTWSELQSRVAPRAPWSWFQRLRRRPQLVMPTEMLHGLWDGGGGANLGSYLAALRDAPRGAGFFLWALADEAVVRVDRNRELDAHGNFAPDGIVGPWREWEASAFAVRELISPVRVVALEPRSGVLELENRFDTTDLADLIASWRWVGLPAVGRGGVAADLGGTSGRISPAKPGGRGRLAVGLPPAGARALFLSLQRPIDGREIASAVVEVPRPRRPLARAETPPGLAQIELRDGVWVLEAGGATARVSQESGELLELSSHGVSWKLEGGTRRADGRRGRVVAVRPSSDGAARLELDFAAGGAVSIATWRLDSAGALFFSWLGEGRRKAPYDGLRFELPAEVTSFEWVGGGPCPVWRNRLAGPRLGTWRQPALGLGLGCSEARGFYSGVEWMLVELVGGTLLVEPEAGLFVGIDVPRFPEDSKRAVATLPRAGALTLLHELPAIGTKFHAPAKLGPEAAPSAEGALFRGSVRLSIVDRSVGGGQGVAQE